MHVFYCTPVSHLFCITPLFQVVARYTGIKTCYPTKPRRTIRTAANYSIACPAEYDRPYPAKHFTTRSISASPVVPWSKTGKHHPKDTRPLVDDHNSPSRALVTDCSVHSTWRPSHHHPVPHLETAQSPTTSFAITGSRRTPEFPSQPRSAMPSSSPSFLSSSLSISLPVPPRHGTQPSTRRPSS